MTALATFAPVLDAVRGIGWPARYRVGGVVPGPHVSRVLGTAAELVEYRPYRQGDDMRKIDWKLVARTDRVYIRRAPQRSILPTMVVIDASASMAFPEPGNGKWELARRVGIGLAEVARQQGDPVGMAVVYPGARIVAPRARRTVLEEMMQAVDIVPTGSLPILPCAREAAMRCARLLIIADFLADADALLALGRRFVAGGGELYAIHVVAASELDPDPKRLLLTDPEEPTVRRPMPRAVRAEYIRRFAAWREMLAREWRQAGAGYTMIVPDAEPIRGAIRRIITPPSSRAARLGH